MLIDRTWLKKAIKYVGLFLYPDYKILPNFRWFNNKKKIVNEIFFLYFFLLIILFIVPGIWSLANQRFFPDNNPGTINFLEDTENLWNYLLVCQLYVIIGYFFIKNSLNLEESLKKNGFSNIVDISGINKEHKSQKGYIGFLLLILLTLYFSAGYAYDITYKSSVTYWFMEVDNENLKYTRLGFYYFFINYLLLLFVLSVGFAYIGFTNKIGVISMKIKSLCKTSSIDELKNRWNDESELKTYLAPISVLVFLAQLFVVILALNLVLWNINSQGIGTNYSASVFALILFGVWLFTLPRYYINYQIFMIWQKIGKHEYKNLNLPWLIGASSLIDIILFSVLLKNLISESWGDLFKNFFGWA